MLSFGICVACTVDSVFGVNFHCCLGNKFFFFFVVAVHLSIATLVCICPRMAETEPIAGIPAPFNCELWTAEEVAAWIGSLGFHEYRVSQ